MQYDIIHFLSTVYKTERVQDLKRRDPKSYLVTCNGNCNRVEIWLRRDNATRSNYDKDGPKLFVSEYDKPMILQDGTCANCINECDGYLTKPDCSNMSIDGNTFFLTVNTFRPKKDVTLHWTNVLEHKKFGQ